MGPEQQDLLSGSDWYHTIELPDGRVTPGFFDHRSVVGRYQLPDDLSGVRALDVGCADGFFSFELERRGAEVVAIDAPDRNSLDFPAPLRRESGRETLRALVDNFEVVRTALGSKVDRRLMTVYEIKPEDLGLFDLVFVGSILIHLRDPAAALMKLAAVCRGQIQVVEEVDRRLDRSRRPLARLQALSPHLTWWIPNQAGWSDLLVAAGFDQVERLGRFVVPYGRGRRGGILHAGFRARPVVPPG
ncbi:MAG TPA: methyltransferase domain-containing protein [Acidimicrobiales bacterium]|nr:methyltransferase domain-containing protein [Acidimicrobiales bacterium]